MRHDDAGPGEHRNRDGHGHRHGDPRQRLDPSPPCHRQDACCQRTERHRAGRSGEHVETGGRFEHDRKRDHRRADAVKHRGRHLLTGTRAVGEHEPRQAVGEAESHAGRRRDGAGIGHRAKQVRPAQDDEQSAKERKQDDRIAPPSGGGRHRRQRRAVRRIGGASRRLLDGGGKAFEPGHTGLEALDGVPEVIERGVGRRQPVGHGTSSSRARRRARTRQSSKAHRTLRAGGACARRDRRAPMAAAGG